MPDIIRISACDDDAQFLKKLTGYHLPRYWNEGHERDGGGPRIAEAGRRLPDNAIEAAIWADEKWIEARAFARQGQLVLRVRNSFRSDSGRHPFTRRPGRGYDLGNVRRVVAQYGGTMEVSANGCFTFSAMLPL